VETLFPVEESLSADGETLSADEEGYLPFGFVEVRAEDALGGRYRQ
jgi:hypothetical protein